MIVGLLPQRIVSQRIVSQRIVSKLSKRKLREFGYLEKKASHGNFKWHLLDVMAQ